MTNPPRLAAWHGKALTETLDPPIRALIVYNSNPGTIAQNQNIVREGL